MSVKYLAVEENTFFWRQRSPNEEVNLICKLVKSLFMFYEPAVQAILQI